ncbi:MAG: sigma-70 family RNA polymerase sigma factor [Planctomycetota bacterium]
MTGDDQKQFFEAWLDRHRGLLFKVVRAYARRPQDQDDLLQEVLFQLWRSLPRYTPEVAQTTWTYRVALYTAIGWARKEVVRTRRVALFEDHGHLLPQPTEPTDPRLDWLYGQIDRLGPFDRSLTVLLLDGCSYREIAEVLGITPSHVGVKLHRIKKHLINQLKENPDDGLCSTEDDMG